MPAWGRVNESWPKALIVGSGPSVQAIRWEDHVIPEDVAVITVNQSIKWVPHPTHWITVDPGIENRTGVMANPVAGVKYYAGVPEHYGTSQAKVRHHREKPPEPHITFLRRCTGSGFLRSREGLSEDPEGLHTGNSGYAALGLAYLMNAKRIALLGIDGHGAYWFETPRRPGKMHHLPDLFASAVPQLSKHGVQVVNGSPDSTITCFPRMEPNEAIEWLVRVTAHAVSEVSDPSPSTRLNDLRNPRS